MSGIYVASKTKHAYQWRAMRDEDGLPINSTWIDEAAAGETSDFDDLWQRCIGEASTAKALIVYMEPGEVLKGAWVELGAALANRVPVFAVGIEGFTIAKFSRITHCRDIGEAIDRALRCVGRAGDAS